MGQDASSVIVENAKTGGKKETRLARFDLLPWDQLWHVAELYGKGAEKYDRWNWAKGYDWSLSLGAMGRHMAKFAVGEDIDEETGCHHLTSVIFHALALMQFGQTHPELDDRFKEAPIRTIHALIEQLRILAEEYGDGQNSD